MDVLTWVLNIPLIFAEFVQGFIDAVFTPITILNWTFCIMDLLTVGGIGILIGLMIYSIAKL